MSDTELAAAASSATTETVTEPKETCEGGAGCCGPEGCCPDDSETDEPQNEPQEENELTSEAKRLKFSPEGGRAVYVLKLTMESAIKTLQDMLARLKEEEYAAVSSLACAKTLGELAEQLKSEASDLFKAIEYVPRGFATLPIDLTAAEHNHKLAKEVGRLKEAKNRERSDEDTMAGILQMLITRSLMGGRK